MVFETGLTPRELFAAVLAVGTATFLYIDRKKINRHLFIFYRRTERGLKLIDNIADWSPRFWQQYGNAGIVAAGISIIAGTVLFARTIGEMAVTRSASNGPSALLPSLGSEVAIQPGVSFIPIEYWVAGIGVLMVVHEMSHGIVARANDFELNSVGWVVMGIIPGAFVEPKGENMLPGADAEENSGGMWDQGTWKQRLQVLAAGSFANYITAAIFIGANFALLGLVASPSGVFYTATEGYPASQAGMTNGTLVEIDGKPVETVRDIQEFSSSLEPNQTVEIWSTEGNFTVTAADAPNSSGGYVGIRVGQSNVVEDQYQEHAGLLQWALSGIYTIGVLNLLIGLFNMLPIKPLDGGLIAETVIDEFWGDGEKTMATVSTIGWAVLLGSLAVSILSQVI